MTYRIVSMLLVTLMTSTAYAEVRPYALEILVFARPEPVQSITEVFPATEPEAPQSFDLLRIQTQLNGEILFHQRWIHPLTENQAENPWFQISGSGSDGFKLNGYLRWSIDRYIELDADLRVTRESVRQATDGTVLNEVYVLKEFRKMSSKDIHYLDHPAFGVLIAAEPIELATPQALPANEASVLETQPQPQAQ